MKIAAIDVGSNAARLLIVEVIINKKKIAEYNKLMFLRLPLRLGFEVFETGEISPQKTEKILNTIQVFQRLMDFYGVKLFRACATSAMRDARNGPEIVKLVEAKTGMLIQVISGDEEANLVHDTHIAENMDKQHGYLYINVGGGSTEVIFLLKGKVSYKKSFNVGTIRLLKNTFIESDWENVKAEIKAHVKSDLPIVAIGSGGNINKIFSLSKRKEGKPLTLDMLKKYYEEFNKLSIAERRRIYKFNPDRAEVIVPALQIYINVMRWSNIKEIYVPKIGLVDGLVTEIYQDSVNNI